MFNPAKASANIKNEFIDYVSTIFSFADFDLQSQLVEELKGEISKGPYLEINDVFCSGKTMNELIDEGVLSNLFRELEKGKPDTSLYKKCLPLDRPLYLHQEKAIRNIVDGKNAVISTGTGSGKTNCFLIPVLNELLRENENNSLGPGVRAMFIYPMNALANDQMKNIRKILMFYPDITFGVYNGATEYDEEAAVNLYESMFSNEEIPELKHRLDNEILSRNMMKKTPPNILFTNYAMLEHLLLRPKDDVLFSNAQFKFIVLDEAHVYTGATGIETALLLRRLKARIAYGPSSPQFILTSATLGSDDSYDNDILKFANNLCGEEFSRDSIIRSSRDKYISSGTEKSYPEELFRELGDEKNFVSDVLTKYKLDIDSSRPESELLYDFLLTSDMYSNMRMSISRITDIGELMRILNVDLDTAIAFISICTRANKNGKSLVDARYHYFIRSLEGCYIAFSPSKKLFLNRKNQCNYNGEQYAVFEIAVCDNCGKYAIVGENVGDKLVQTNMSDHLQYFYLSEQENDEIEDEEDGEEDINKSDKNDFALCIHCGMMFSKSDYIPNKCECGWSDFINVTRARNLSSGARCGNCHTGAYRRFYLGNDAATAVLATALYEELPEIEYMIDVPSESKKNLFTQAIMKSQRKQSKHTGRQFLAFSDSRQEAAKFACYLEKSYNEFLRRRGICQIIKTEKINLVSNAHTISDYVSLLTNFFTTKKSFAKSNTDDSNLTIASRKNAWVAMLNELGRYNSSTSLTSLGIIQFSYLGNTSEIVKAVADQYKVDENVMKNLLDLLVFEIVKAGAIKTDTDSDIDDNDREYIFYSPSQRFIKKNRDLDSKVTISGWMPKAKPGKIDEYYKNSKLYYVTNSLGISQKEAADFLEQYFDFLVDPSANKYRMESPNKDGTYVMPAKNFKVLIPGCREAKWYKCSKCGKISQFSLSGHCSTLRCEGELEEVTPETLGKDNHYAKLYYSDRMSPLFIKEHTAQLSKKEGAEYQEQFVKKEINALSCSTTFEMGVDVGDLETVFLRDVPPLPSNYAQRAGRAGRSLDAAAYALTFAKLSSHDLSFFTNPEKMIQGTILPPLFKIDNEKIVRRHIYAVALGMYFKENPEQYNGNDASKFINEKGYLEFENWLRNKPEKLSVLLKKSIPDIDGLYERIGLEDFSWLADFIGNDGVFTQLLKEYEGNVANFNKLISEYKKKNDLNHATICKRKLDIYTKNNLIDFLARGNILPRYGFPVDTVELEQNTTAKNINKLRLNRDLQIAIAEYAPSSEIIADGRLYTSRYIKKAQIGEEKRDWHTAYIAKCKNSACNTMNYSLTPITKSGISCMSCGKRLEKFDFFESIEPRNGFVTERLDRDVPMTKQEKNYKTEDFYIGNNSAKTIEKYYFRFGSVYVKVESTTNDSLMVKSTTNFYVCPKCGYAIAADESIGDSKQEKLMQSAFPPLNITTPKAHESLYQIGNCDCKDLKRRTLHHVFNTDVAKISFSTDSSDYKKMISTMYAVLFAVAQELNIERRDIKACLSLAIDNSQKYSIIIYDAVPGGAGHSRRLVTKDGNQLLRIFRAAFKRVEDCNCDPSCYNCLRSYENQRIHDTLDRKLAAEFLSPLCENVSQINEEVAEQVFKDGVLGNSQEQF